jgi:hypothetical protein
VFYDSPNLAALSRAHLAARATSPAIVSYWTPPPFSHWDAKFPPRVPTSPSPHGYVPQKQKYLRRQRVAASELPNSKEQGGVR